MDEKLFNLRRYYFAFLYASFVYLALLLIILRDSVSNVYIARWEQILISLTALIPLFIFIKRKKGDLFKEGIYIKFLIVGHFPLWIGSLLSFIEKSYTFFLMSYPVFLLAYVLLFPTKKGLK